jgi:transcriptional regulator of acetoin/glycerol metabolism
MPSDHEGNDLLAKVDDEPMSVDLKAVPKVLTDLSKAITSMSSSMLNMDQSIKRMNSTQVETSDSEEQPAKKRKTRNEQENEADSDASDGENLLRETEPPADSATEGESGVSCARLEHDALLTLNFARF